MTTLMPAMPIGVEDKPAQWATFPLFNSTTPSEGDQDEGFEDFDEDDFDDDFDDDFEEEDDFEDDLPDELEEDDLKHI